MSFLCMEPLQLDESFFPLISEGVPAEANGVEFFDALCTEPFLFTEEISLMVYPLAQFNPI